MILASTVSIVGLVIIVCAIYFSKKGQFYSDTHLLIPLGIFVWGDGLVLGPFWFLSGLLFSQLDLLFILRYVLLFWAIRSGYEVVYWLTHQASRHEYEPPLFRNISWLNAQQGAILYQLMTTLGLFFSLFGLVYSYNFS